MIRGGGVNARFQPRSGTIGGAAYIASLAPAAWFRFGIGLTQAGGFASQWDDQSGNGRHLKQASGTNQPAVQADSSLLFDGSDNYMKCDAFTLNQPETVYLLLKQITWTSQEAFCDGNTLNTMRVYQVGVTPQIQAYAGSGSGVNGNLALDTYGAVCAVLNGASSLTQVGATSPVTGAAGAANAGGFILGAAGNTGDFSNIQVKEAIVFAAAHDAATRATVIRYLGTL